MVPLAKAAPPTHDRGMEDLVTAVRRVRENAMRLAASARRSHGATYPPASIPVSQSRP